MNDLILGFFCLFLDKGEIMADNHYLQYQLIGQLFLFLINSL